MSRIYSASAVVNDYKRVPTTTGIGFMSVVDGQSTVTYEVTVSDLGVLDMVCRAARNKGGKCVDGPLTVRILKREKVIA